MTEAMVLAPDGGWGWMVVLGSFGVHAVHIGLIRSYGALFPLVKNFYGTSFAATQWIGSLAAFLVLGLAPVATALSQRLSARVVVMVGSVISCLGLVASYFCSVGGLLFLTYGLISGTGFGLAFAPSVVIVGLYFDKRRSLATSLAVSGAGIGNFVLPILIGIFEKYFTLSGCFLFLAALMLQGAVCGALYIPVETYKNKFMRAPSKDTPEVEMNLLSENGQVNCKVPLKENDIISKTSDVMKKTPINALKVQISRPSNSMEHLNKKNKDEAILGVVSRSDNELSLLSPTAHLTKKSPLTRSTLEITGELAQAISMESLGKRSVTAGESRNQDGEREETIEENNKSSKCSIFGMYIVKFDPKDPRPALFDFSLLREKVLVLYCATAFLGYLSFYVGLVVLVDFAKENGISESTGRLMLSVIGAINMFARIALGWFTDLKVIPIQTVYGGTIIVQGLLLLFQPLLKTVVTLWVFSVLYGIFCGSVIALHAVVMAEVMGVHRLAGSYGISVFFMALSMLVGPTLMGVVRDRTGSWDVSLVIMGLCSVLGGSLAFAEGVVSWRRKRRQDSSP